jgi:Zn-dependent protease with chaperone function
MNGSGKYFNGRTPLSRSVRFYIENNELVIHEVATQLTIAKWSLEKISQDESHSVATVLFNKETGEKLEVIEANDLNSIAPKKFHFKSPAPIKLALLLFSISVLLFSVWKTLPVISGAMAVRIPIATEKEWTKKLSLAPVNRLELCQLDTDSKQALNIVIHSIYPVYSDEKADDIEVQVSNSTMINAFTFPGGKIILMRGLIESSRTPEELAGVLAHEIEHAKKRHVTAMLIRSSFLTFIFHFLSGDFSSVFAVDPSTALSIASLSFDREMEAAADLGGLKRMQKVNINPGDFKNLFNHTMKTPKFLAFLSNHPTDESRIEMIKNHELKSGRKIQITAEQWKSLQSGCYSSSHVRNWNPKK